MDERELLYIVENYTNHEDEKLRNEAKKAWELLREKGKKIEESALKIPVEVPKDAKSQQQLLDEIMEKIHRCCPGQEAFLKKEYAGNRKE